MSGNHFTQLELTRPLAIVQVQATGTNPRRDRIVAITIQRMEAGKKAIVRHHWVNPGVADSIMLEIARTTDPERRVRVATFRTVRHWVQELLEGCDLAGYGLKRFDLPLLQAEFTRANDAFDLSGRAVIDCQQIFERIRPSDLEAAVSTYLGRELAIGAPPQKRIRAIASLLEALLKSYPCLPRSPAGLSRRFGECDAFKQGVARCGIDFGPAGPQRTFSERLRENPELFYVAWCREMLQQSPRQRSRFLGFDGR